MLDSIYRARQRQLSGNALRELMLDGRRWLVMRSACLGNVKCLNNWYDSRIAWLDQISRVPKQKTGAPTSFTANPQIQDSGPTAATKDQRMEEEETRQEAAVQEAARHRAAEQAAEEKRREAAEAIAAKQEEERRTAAIRAANEAEQEQEKRDHDYTKEGVEEVIVDYPQMGDSAKVIVSGYFTSLGQIASLSSDRFSLHDIYLDTSQLSRDTRLVLLKCQDLIDGCLITIWAHRGCVVTAFGHENDAAPCFVVEAIRPGTYQHPITNRILH